MDKGLLARILLLGGSGVFIVGIVAGFTGIAIKWPDLSAIAIVNLAVGGIMAGVGLVMTLAQEFRLSRTAR
jgi:hypothetical protein